MKVYWSIEGVGCQFQQCGNGMRLLENALDKAEALVGHLTPQPVIAEQQT